MGFWQGPGRSIATQDDEMLEGALKGFHDRKSVDNIVLDWNTGRKMPGEVMSLIGAHRIPKQWSIPFMLYAWSYDDFGVAKFYVTTEHFRVRQK